MANSTTDPIAQLMQEHNDALSNLKLLNKAVAAFTRDGYSAKNYKQILEALAYIEAEVGDHNKREEDALFPVLERYVEGPTKAMRDDHKKLKKASIQLKKAVEKVNAHRDSFSAIKAMSTIATGVVQLFVNHIHKENHILFPMVQQLISKEELREVARKML